MALNMHTYGRAYIPYTPDRQNEACVTEHFTCIRTIHINNDKVADIHMHILYIFERDTVKTRYLHTYRYIAAARLIVLGKTAT